jgi:hypothetical protein
MRPLAVPFVVAPPSGARVRTRLRPSGADEQLLRVVGEHLGRLAGADVAVGCRLGRGDDRRADRKRALTAAASSRWAGAITRTSNDQWSRADANLRDAGVGLRRASSRIRSRLQVPAGERHHQVRGYATAAERFAKQGRLQHLEARLAAVERRLADGRVSVCRGGRRLAKLRHSVIVGDGDHGGNGGTCRLSEAEWRARWQAERLFLTADGEADKRWGNETIRVHPDEGWLELRLPARWHPCPTRPAGRRLTGWPARSCSTIAVTSGPRRPPAAPCATTCSGPDQAALVRGCVLAAAGQAGAVMGGAAPRPGARG